MSSHLRVSSSRRGVPKARAGPGAAEASRPVGRTCFRIGLRERFAGSLLLLYDQPLTRTAQLRTSDITTADSGEIALTFARGAIVLPKPLASIALALRYQRAGDDEQDGWLLPGRKPGTHITAEHLRK